MQTIIGSLMLYISWNVDALLVKVSVRWEFQDNPNSRFSQPADNVNMLTFVFVSLVAFSATQGKPMVLSACVHVSYIDAPDIAVDGNHIVVLSDPNSLLIPPIQAGH
jgi:hypothetical protein